MFTDTLWGIVVVLFLQLIAFVFSFGAMYQKQKDMQKDIDFIKRHLFNGRKV